MESHKNTREVYSKKNEKRNGGKTFEKFALPFFVYWRLIQEKKDELKKALLSFENALKEIEKLETQKTESEVKPKPHITNLVIGKKELTAQLDDGRELSIPID
jgi:hypothetical protein